jgi:hypothetical protein
MADGLCRSLLARAKLREGPSHMPAVPEWDVLLRGGVLRALGQRGCRSGWTVSNFRGRARLHITARAAGGHRRQSIRDGAVKLYGDFQEGVPLERAIAELSAAAPQPRTPVPRSMQQQAARSPSIGLG